MCEGLSWAHNNGGVNSRMILGSSPGCHHESADYYPASSLGVPTSDHPFPCNESLASTNTVSMANMLVWELWVLLAVGAGKAQGLSGRKTRALALQRPSLTNSGYLGSWAQLAEIPSTVLDSLSLMFWAWHWLNSAYF